MDGMTARVPALGSGAGDFRRLTHRWLTGGDCSYPALFWLALAGGTVAALAHDVAPVPVLVAAVGAGGWYLAWTAPRLAGRHARLVGYVAGSGVAWLGLMSLDRGYGLVGVVLFARLFGLLSWRAAMAALAPVLAVIVLATGLVGTAPALSWRGVDPGRSGGTALTLALVALCLYLGRRAELARAELAAAQREVGVLAERERLAADLHDTVTQELAGVVMLLEAARAEHDGAVSAGAALDRALEAARGAVGEVRGLVRDLRPARLRGRALPDALSELTASLAARSGVRARTVVTGRPVPATAAVETAVLRVAQEAMSNAVRHSAADQVTATLSYIGDTLTLDVVDDGIGFDPDAVTPGPNGGLGLPGMRARLAALGGTLDVESQPGHGTCLAATLPLEVFR